MATQALVPVQKLKNTLAKESVQEQFRNALQEGAPLFIASLIDIYGSDTNLQRCEPNAVIMEALKAATLKLPINRNLGFAYIVPYGNMPNFQLGYKGYIQLAERTGLYRFINADVVCEGEFQGRNKLTGEIDLNGEKTSDKVVGYFAYIETVNGFKKALYRSVEEVEAHAKRYSKTFSNKSSAWKTNFDEMALKTVLRNLLSKYGIMSIEMSTAFANDATEEREMDVLEPQPTLDESILRLNGGDVGALEGKTEEEKQHMLADLEVANVEKIKEEMFPDSNIDLG